MSTRLILVSHALTDWNLKGLIQGHTDVPLNRTGHDMALKLSGKLALETIHAVYASDLKRAWQTARPAAQARGLKVFTDSGLRECRTFRQVKSPVYPTLPFENRIETRSMALKRFHLALTRIVRSHDQETLLLVSHAGIIDIFINTSVRHIRSKPWCGIRMAINVLEYDSGYWKCIVLNKDCFL